LTQGSQSLTLGLTLPLLRSLLKVYISPRVAAIRSVRRYGV